MVRGKRMDCGVVRARSGAGCHADPIYLRSVQVFLVRLRLLGISEACSCPLGAFTPKNSRSSFRPSRSTEVFYSLVIARASHTLQNSMTAKCVWLLHVKWSQFGWARYFKLFLAYSLHQGKPLRGFVVVIFLNQGLIQPRLVSKNR